MSVDNSISDLQDFLVAMSLGGKDDKTQSHILFPEELPPSACSVSCKNRLPVMDISWIFIWDTVFLRHFWDVSVPSGKLTIATDNGPIIYL